MDYFVDGSVFIIDAPGHVAGHLNLLVRIDSEKCMYLAGDTAHDVRVYKGAREKSDDDEEWVEVILSHGKMDGEVIIQSKYHRIKRHG
ncbi:hypothetical protein PABG_12058 [Paracoccidioides brasiliensis Pb03]|uniref:Metallo-beta-lactamase domain-containing protein n=1 Tax=Paracoccidioides brasiliensis TaxID=121759 RepID=A0A1D2JFV9_PARBR|nr:hypothetical protein PABG_12058 [Paracoccidioides brasiliensis Pb03]ODH31674.1 hypothetical protein ACO22_03436 [Paracoccidioides brasiliensis]